MKKVLILGLCAAMLAGMVGCGGGGNTTSGGGDTSGTADKGKTESGGTTGDTSASGGEAKIDTSKPVDLVWYSLGDIPTNDQLDLAKAEWDKILKEKVNATLTFKFIPWTDWSTQYNLKLASGEAFDMINTATDWLNAWPNAQRGAFMDMKDLLPTYAPITWGSVTAEEWDQCKYNDQIVMIPENQYTQWINHGFFYRGDWATEAGITEPIRDWETIGKYLQYIKDNKPGVVPWDVAGSNKGQFGNYVISKTDAIQLEPVGSGPYYSRDYEHLTDVFCPVFEDIYIDYAKMMHEWNANGYWREDVLNYEGDTRELLKEGKTGMDQHHTQTYRGLRVDMDEKQPGSELQMFPFAMERGNNLIEMSITHGAQSIPASCKNPERTLMVYDLVRNDKELYMLINYGREGTQYVYNDAGLMTRPEGYDDTRDKFYTDFWGGRMDSLEPNSDRNWSRIGEVYAEFDKVKKPFPYAKFVWDQTPVQNEIVMVENVYNSGIAEIAFGKTADPVAAVEKLRADMKAAGVDTVIAEITKQLKAWKPD